MDLAYENVPAIARKSEDEGPVKKETENTDKITTEPTETPQPVEEKPSSEPTTKTDSTEAKPLLSKESTKKATEALNKAADTFENSINNIYSKVTTTAKSSGWGSTFGGLWNKVKEQSQTALNETKLEFQELKGEIDELLGSVTTSSDVPPSSEESQDKDLSKSTDTVTDDNNNNNSTKPTGMLALLTTRAQQYIDELDKDLEEFENKAGSKLLKMGTDLQSVLKESIVVAGPDGSTASPFSRLASLTSSGSGSTFSLGFGGSNNSNNSKTPETSGKSEVLFNVSDDLRDQIYTTRLDAQLHALHTTKEPFLVKASSDPKYDEFSKTFDIKEQTETIAQDLEKYPKLRTLMESLVPEQVAYNEFWSRYYFMRREINEQEEKRKKLLAESQEAAEEKIDWDDDDEDEDDNDKKNDSETPTPTSASKTDLPKTTQKEAKPAAKTEKAEDATTTTTASATASTPSSPTNNLPASSRPSSESSYDLVSKSSSVLDLAKEDSSIPAVAPATTQSNANSTSNSKVNSSAASSSTVIETDEKKKPAQQEEEDDSDDDWE